MVPAGSAEGFGVVVVSCGDWQPRAPLSMEYLRRSAAAVVVVPAPPPGVVASSEVTLKPPEEHGVNTL